jgi:hypothetical protein
MCPEIAPNKGAPDTLCFADGFADFLSVRFGEHSTTMTQKTSLSAARIDSPAGFVMKAAFKSA